MPEPGSSVRVVDNPDLSRYEAYVGDALAGFVIYEKRPGVVVLVHTEVHDAFEGRGVGSRLASTALGDAGAQGLKVDPVCPFVAAYLERHPEYADLVAGGSPGA